MHLQVCGEEEKGKNTRALARQARRGGVWRGEAMDVGPRCACE
jgi:hypothetical protein